MRDYHDARSESWQDSENGEQFAKRQDSVEVILSQLEELTL